MNVPDVSYGDASYKTIPYFVKRAFDIAVDKGFHDDDEAVQPATRLLLIVSEIIECFEEIRIGKGFHETYYTYTWTSPRGVKFKNLTEAQYEEISGHNVADYDGDRKPEGVPAELADVMIRLFDFAGTYGIDLMAAILSKMKYNEGREYKHGKQF